LRLLKCPKCNQNKKMRINIELPEELHTALKVRAAVEGITLKQLIINILKTDL
jgi:predicted DNA binding CopG/RHH family protein